MKVNCTAEFVARPNPTGTCVGCVGQGNIALCNALGMCAEFLAEGAKHVVWVVKPSNPEEAYEPE